jgi:hypothetical protein
LLDFLTIAAAVCITFFTGAIFFSMLLSVVATRAVIVTESCLAPFFVDLFVQPPFDMLLSVSPPDF